MHKSAVGGILILTNDFHQLGAHWLDDIRSIKAISIVFQNSQIQLYKVSIIL